MSAKILIPILHELPDLPLLAGDIIYVWRNYVYYLAPSPSPDTRLIIEADISTRLITQSIPMNIIPVDTSLRITADNPTNKYEPWYIYKCENSMCLIEKINKNPNSHHHTYDVNIYMKNTITNQEYPPIQLKNIRRICDIIDNSGKLYIAVWDYAELRINVNGGPKPTWFKILVIDTNSNSIIHTISALNDTIYKLDIIGNKLIACQNWFGPQKVIWDIDNLSAAPQIIRQIFISYARHNNLLGGMIYPYNGWVGINLNFIESDNYQIVNTLNTPMAELEMVDIINDKFYIGLPQTSSNNKLQIYNLQTHQLIATTLFEFTSNYSHSKFRPYYISNGHIIFSTPSAVKTYKIEERQSDERKNRYKKIIANLADEYCLARHLELEIQNHFTVELQEYKPCEIIIQT
jgi:hypothetical protein